MPKQYKCMEEVYSKIITNFEGVNNCILSNVFHALQIHWTTNFLGAVSCWMPSLGSCVSNMSVQNKSGAYIRSPRSTCFLINEHGFISVFIVVFLRVSKKGNANRSNCWQAPFTYSLALRNTNTQDISWVVKFVRVTEDKQIVQILTEQLNTKRENIVILNL